MRRLLLLSGILVSFMVMASCLLLPQSALAETCQSSSTGDPFMCLCGATQQQASVCNDNGGEDPITGVGSHSVLIKVINLISLAAGVAAVIVAIVGGLMMILSNGDPSKVTGARNAVVYAVVGLIIIAAAQAIIRFVIVRMV